jgi:hypothetical protein
MRLMRNTSRRRQPVKSDLDKLREMLSLAESDPVLFRTKCADAAASLGITVEQVYELLQDKEQLKNVAVVGAAKLARRMLGLL